MATPYERVVRTTVNHNPVKATGPKRSNHKAFIILVLIFIAGIAWYNSDYWPWPSSERINERLNKVIDICNGNETSTACKDIQKRYNMTFMYCKSSADLFGSNKKYQTYYGPNGMTIDIPQYDWYAVAWEGTSSTPPENKIRLSNGETLSGFNNYYGCEAHK